MKQYSTSLLLNLLARLILLQIGALKVKQFTELEWENIRIGTYPKGFGRWSFCSGICENVFAVDKYETIQTQTDLSYILKQLFRACPSGSGYGGLPVRPVEIDNRTIGYGMSKRSMWGNHPYADNRRQIITECIDQLHKELKSRGYDVG